MLDKSWTDFIPVALIAVAGSLLIWAFYQLDNLEEINKKSNIAIEENQYETMSNYLKTDEENIIISGENGDGFLVKTNKKSYTVIFNDDGKAIEKIIEN